MRRVYPIILVFLALILAACGSQGASTQVSAEPTVTPTPILPTHAYQEPTAPPAIATAAAATKTAEASGSGTTLDPVAVERGKGRYEALECGTCHGDNGEGTDQGSALAGTELTEGEFITYLRTGGTIGNDHLYSTNRLSDSGGRNLYIYVLSLSAE